MIDTMHISSQLLVLTLFACCLPGDPLYITGGHPNCFDLESGNDTCALDGYENFYASYVIS